jgi:hypothetical protein
MYADLSIKPCPFCHCRTYMRIRAFWTIDVHSREELRTTRMEPTGELFVCRDCGRTESFIDDPEETFEGIVSDPNLDADLVEVEDLHPYRDPG